MSILVLGLGELGFEVCKSLALHPNRSSSKLAVLLRSSVSHRHDPARLALHEQLKAWNVGVITRDVVTSSTEDLAKIFAPFDTVISCNGMTLPPETQPKLAHAALQGNVKRFFPWQFGIDYDAIGRNSSQNLFDAQLDVRDLLRSQDQMAWVIVSTGMFISFLFVPAFGLVDREGAQVTALGSWENELTVTSPEDIGRATAELALVDGSTQGVVYVSGDTISMRRLADVAEKVIGRPVTRTLKTVEDLDRELTDDPEDGMKKYRAVFGKGVGVAWPKSASYNAAKGFDMQSVYEWAKRHLS